jgi:drug/metabolite transporter (DMT)-like permease
VLLAAFAHAGWNFLAKTARASAGSAPFAWLCAVWDAVLLTPLGIVALTRSADDIGGAALVFIVGAGALHGAYFVSLQRGYREGDLSLVYPLARGIGPLLATVFAISVLGERPSLVALAGGAIIVAAVLSLTGGPRLSRPGADAAVLWAGLTGVLIAAYTLWDKHAVDALGISPILYFWGAELCRAAILTPVVARRPGAASATWREDGRRALWVGAMSSFAYILVLYALAVAPVSYVAPAREVSILIGAALGAQLLAEGDPRRRLLCAGAIVLGVAALAIG